MLDHRLRRVQIIASVIVNQNVLFYKYMFCIVFSDDNIAYNVTICADNKLYMIFISMFIMFNPFSAGFDIRRQILTSKDDPRTERAKYL